MSQAAPGWYPNPSRPDRFLYWDGAQWRTGPDEEVLAPKERRYISFIPAIGMGFTRWKDFAGRSSRSEYWWWRLFIWLVTYLPTRLGGSVSSATVQACAKGHKSYLSCSVFASHSPMYLLGLLLTLALLVPDLAITVRRLHDIGKSGWWVIAFIAVPQLLIFFPINLGSAGLFILLDLVTTIWMIVWTVRVGEGSANQWGMVPQHPPR
jgi:uncharacterized membrane protein YhaH (DUF805 family)